MPAGRTQIASNMPKREVTGFSLVEILVVVMVILIIAAIAIPNLVHARMRANEAAAAASVKTIQTAEVMYNNTYPEVGYAGSLPNLGSHGSTCESLSSTNSCIIMDEALTSGLKDGFIFEVVGDGNIPDGSYTVTAAPESSVSGRCAIVANQAGDFNFVAANASWASSRTAGPNSGASSGSASTPSSASKATGFGIHSSGSSGSTCDQ